MKALSLTARLSLLFALSAVVVLLGLGWVVARSVEAHFLELDRHEMEGKLALVRNLLAKVQTPTDFAALPRELDDALVGHPGLAVRVLAPDGALRFATGEVQVPAGEAAGIGLAQGRWRLWQEGGRWFRTLTAGAPTGLTPDRPDTVVIGLDISHHRHFMAGFRRTLAMAMALAALLTGVLGWAATRAGLRPLRRVTALASTLEASRLGARLPEARVPAEIETLVVAFNAMLARLEDSFRRLSEFSADIAHELRTPVGNLMIQTQVALSDARTLDQYREILYSSLEEYERMAQMISDMLFLAQADNGLLKPSTTAVDLAAEVRDLFDCFDAWSDERGVTLALDGSAAAVTGDRPMLRRALSNLLTNAIRHTPAGQSVQVYLEADTQGTRITFENPGVQVPAEHLPRLFDRFYRVDPVRRRQGEGAGLGLAIVKSIVTAHGGTIGVTSSEGGTQFVIVLPRMG
ncbi:MAG: heavy metal sensor histidine kinase [Chromatiaceae bacterium]|nr:heavy metal sensor histidine kinase [Chromatiaceae bacterium]